MKTELKNCLSLYKIFYSCAFILILCVIHRKCDGEISVYPENRINTGNMRLNDS